MLDELLLVVNLCLSYLVNLMQPETPLNRYRQASWEINELLEMQYTATLGIHRRASGVFISGVETTIEDWLDEKEAAVTTQEEEKQQNFVAGSLSAFSLTVSLASGRRWANAIVKCRTDGTAGTRPDRFHLRCARILR